MIQEGVDIIFSIPASPTAMNGVIEEAYKAGIPVLTLSAPVTSAYAINVDTNQLVYGARQAQGLVMLLEGKGDIFAVEGIAGTPGSQGIEEGGKLILEQLPRHQHRRRLLRRLEQRHRQDGDAAGARHEHRATSTACGSRARWRRASSRPSSRSAATCRP